VALAELCIVGGLGCEAAIPIRHGQGTDGGGCAARADTALFGEGASRILLEVAPEAEAAIRELAARHEVPCVTLGRVTDDGMLSMTLGRAEAGAKAGTAEGAQGRGEDSAANGVWWQDGGRGPNSASHGDSMRVALAVTTLREQWEGAIPWVMR
jgi:hypothetical protein